MSIKFLKNWTRALSISLLILLVSGVGSFFTNQKISFEASATTIEKIASVRVPFIKNEGQLNSEVDFYADTFAGRVFTTERGIVYGLNSKIEEKKQAQEGEEIMQSVYFVKESFVDGFKMTPVGEGQGSTTLSFFLGDDKSKWKSGVSSFDAVNMGKVWEGIDLSVRAYGGTIEKIFTVHPGSSPKKIEMSLTGARKIEITEKGDLEITGVGGSIGLTAPVAYQMNGEEKQSVKVEYVLTGESSYAFKVGRYDTSRDLIIDPVLFQGLLASTFFGGAVAESNGSLAIDSSGNIYVAGTTTSTDLPTTGGAYDTTQNTLSDGFVAKFDASLTTLLASTYIGGTGTDLILDMKLDSSGNVYVAGRTGAGYPTTGGAYDTSHNGSLDGFISEFNSGLTSLSASTYLGGTASDSARGLAFDGSGNVYVTGLAATGFPTTGGAYDTTLSSSDGYIAKFNSSLTTLSASTFITGNGNSEIGSSLAIDGSGNVYVFGRTNSTDFATTVGAYDTTLGGTGDFFISEFNSSLTTLTAATLLGGSGNNEAVGNNAGGGETSIAFDASGNIYVVGTTDSTDFPTVGGEFQVTNAGGTSDVVVAKMNSTLTSLLAATYLGGSGTESGGASLALDSSGNVYVSGLTTSSDFPTTAGAFSRVYSTSDVFISKFNAGLTSLVASTFLGGAGAETKTGGSSMVVDSSGDIYVIGSTSGLGFPTTRGVYDQGYNGAVDTFITKLRMGSKFAKFSKQSYNDGLVFYAPLDDAEGTTARNYGSIRGAGTLTNFALTGSTSNWVSGKRAGALDFDGTNDIINFGAKAGVYDLTTDLSAFIWLKTTDTAWDAFGSLHGNGGWGVGTGGCSSGIIGGYVGSVWRCASTAVNDGAWHHVGVTLDSASSGTLKYYIDGVQNGSTVTSAGAFRTPGVSGSTGLNIGDEQTNTRPFAGQLDEARLYNRALTSTEVSQLYADTGLRKMTVNASLNTVAPSSLVTWHTFDGAYLNTTTSTDRSANAYNGTLTNGPVPVLGKVGQAMKFDGSNDYVSVADNNSLDLTDLSIAFWFKPNETLSSATGRKDFLTKYLAYWIILNYPGSDGKLILTTGSGGTSIRTTNTSWTAGEWYHFVGTISGGTGTIYVNGVQDVTGSVGTPSATANNLHFGGSGDAGSYPNITMDDFRLYNKALSASEVLSLYNQSK